jgi:hypothetical protein
MRKPNKQKLEATRSAWDKRRRAAHPRKSHLHLVVDFEADTLAVAREHVSKASELLKNHKITFINVGDFDKFRSPEEKNK